MDNRYALKALNNAMRNRIACFLLNLKGDTEIALKQREGSALRYRYLSLFGIPVIPISKSSLRI
jgi:hypothetical protein